MAVMKGLGFLTDTEAAIVRETEPARLAALDEDAVLELHARVRRARNKYVKLYRQQAAARVAAKGGRGQARPANRGNADKAEVFELALSRVSKRTDVLARQAAAELKAERLAAAHEAKATAATAARPPADGKVSGAGRKAAATKSTGGVKRDASSRAAGARRQAKKDAR